MKNQPLRFVCYTQVLVRVPLVFLCGVLALTGCKSSGSGGSQASAGSSLSSALSLTSSSAGDLSSSSAASVSSAQQASSSSQVSIPLSGMENSGRDCFVPALPAYANLASSIAALPDPFRGLDGESISSKHDWTCRRAEVSKQAQYYELGEKPEPDTDAVTAAVVDNTITVTVEDNGSAIAFSATIQLPATGVAPYPAMIGMGGSSLNNTELLNRGIAVINFNNNDIAEQTNGSSRGRGKFYTLYGSNHGAGAMTAWAWGVSRLIDALEKTPDSQIDTRYLGVTGCSRNGKGALIAGALDERIALTIPQESGSGGSAAWRVSDAQKAAGQNVQTLSQIVTENVWFRSSFAQFSSTATRLPFDHHQVMGLVAPRALLVLENTSMEWLGNVSTYTAAVVAREIWIALGVTDHMAVSQLGGYWHCTLPESQQPLVDAFVDKFLKGITTADTDVVRTDGEYTVDRARWIDWETPGLH